MQSSVLILIVVEYGLGEISIFMYIRKKLRSLNPYCSGIWSRSVSEEHPDSDCSCVLILIVVEYGLGVLSVLVKDISVASLNPYCSGIWSRSLD